MSFEQDRDESNVATATARPTTPAANSFESKNENELPPPPKSEPQTPRVELDSETRERLDHVLQSDIGVSTLLNRLKQSISSARDFAAFLKDRSAIEEKHAQGIKKLSRSTHEIIRRPESKGGSFAHNFEEITKVHDRMSDNGLQFANSLYQMHEELQELTAKCERDRKHLKQTGLDAEKTVQDAESAMGKAKGKYNTLAEQLDGVKTGERTSGKFGRRKDEDELRRKLETADGEYAQKVQAAQSYRRDLHTTHRPRAVSSLQDSIRECDAGLSMQMQKYAALSERLLLGNGLCVSPLKNQANGAGSGPRSLRDIAQNVNDQRDFHEYVLGFTNKAGHKPPEIKYEQHPSLAPKQQQPNQPPSSSNFNNSQSQFGTPERQNASNPYERGPQPHESGQISGVMPYQPPDPERQFSGPPPGQYQSGPPPPNTYGTSQAPQLPQIGSMSDSGPRAGLGSPVGSTPDPRQGASLAPTQSRPDQFGGEGSSNGYDPPGPGPVGDGRGGASGPGFHPSSRGPSMGGVSQPSSRGPSFGQPSDFAGPGRGAPYSQQPSQQQSGEFGGTGRDVPYSQQPSQQQAQQPSRFGGAGRGAPYSQQPSQQPSQQQSYQPDPRGAPSNSQGPPVGQSNGPFRPPQPQSSGSTGPGAGPGMNLPSQQRRADMQRQNPLPVRPVFGVPLDELFRRDGSAVPHIVFRCIEAVDLHGLNTEGIYRTSGSAPVIMDLRAQFDHDASSIDFRNPSAYRNDIASVTTLLKHFLRDLPDPLLTATAYSQFIQAAQIDDDHMRRDSLHAIINSLPDPNYATLRVLTLHLYRVAQHAERNRMTPHNLAICLGPTFMGQSGREAQGDIKDAGWQARVVETILDNALQVFDDDE